MISVQQHYDQVLAGFYTWLYGGYAAGLKTNTEFFNRHGITPAGSGTAVDLGAGSGFQSIPLAAAGFTVTAFDLCERLLQELSANDTTGSIRTVQADLVGFDQHVSGKIELITCMTDTLLHLESLEKVEALAKIVFNSLEENGRFIVTFRDLTHELTGLDRLLPVRSDEKTIFTCFLEYRPDTVNVHDIIYHNNGDGWQLYKSCYPKLRLPPDRVKDCLTGAGLNIIESENTNGLITIIAQKKTEGI